MQFSKTAGTNKKLNRNEHFSNAVAPAVTVNDSRFGLREMPQNNEAPSTFSYSSPGRGASGEHQN